MTTATPDRPLGEPLPFRLLLDEAVRHARSHFRRIYPAVAIPLALAASLMPLAQGLLVGGMGGASGENAPNLGLMIGGVLGFFAAMLVFMAVYGLAYGALMTATVDAVAERAVSMKRAWGFVVRPRVMWTLMLATLAAALGTFFCILPGIYLGLLLSLTLPVMVDEGLFGTAALRRSAQLTRYNPRRAFDADPRVKVFVVLFVGTLLGYVINMAIQMPVVILQQVLMMRQVTAGQRPDPTQMMGMMTWIQVPSQVLGALVTTAVHLYVCFGIALLFFDVKRRKEGLDLEAAVARLAESRLGPPPVAS